MLNFIKSFCRAAVKPALAFFAGYIVVALVSGLARNWGTVGDYVTGAGILLSAIPVTIALIYGINWVSNTKYAKRFDAWFDGKN